MMCRFLDGEKLDISTISKRRELIGKRVTYLRQCDIDKSGRGMFFPRCGEIVAIYGKNVEFENGSIEQVSEIVEATES